MLKQHVVLQQATVPTLAKYLADAQQFTGANIVRVQDALWYLDAAQGMAAEQELAALVGAYGWDAAVLHASNNLQDVLQGLDDSTCPAWAQW